METVIRCWSTSSGWPFSCPQRSPTHCLRDPHVPR